ncbi:hypothetical protein BDF14DRAFT_1869056 [Spinellus fusiger]|nr:hypothetical protein BDF14DRAFT_1869056 [Spinellus fusiger]
MSNLICQAYSSVRTIKLHGNDMTRDATDYRSRSLQGSLHSSSLVDSHESKPLELKTTIGVKRSHTQRHKQPSVEKKTTPPLQTPPPAPSSPSSPSALELGHCKRPRRYSSGRLSQPRWHNQSYLLFLALRQHPSNSLPRTDLIKAALDLDKQISEERDLPRVFRGKTPMNSASAILTNNIDGYFIPFRPHGSRCMHFTLAYKPISFEKACAEYRTWEDKLVTESWPFYFRTLTKKDTYPALHKEMTEFDEFIASRSLQSLSKGSGHCSTEKDSASMTPMGTFSQGPSYIPHPMHSVHATPTSWRDLVRVEGDRGVFALRSLPPHLPLGLYFGVPMSEDEFGSLKQGVGKADAYSLMFRHTILDATDDIGEPYRDSNGPVYCPFHFLNETCESMANVVFLEGHQVNQVICWTKQDIKEGDELLVWYNRTS